MIAEFNKVSKIYDGVVVGVSEIDLELPKGITGFLGPNGSGKSTCIKLLAGELRPTAGQVSVMGVNPWNNPSLQNELAYISEINTQFEFLTPIKLLTYLGRLHGLPREESKKIAMNALDQLGLSDFYNRKLTALSKGMKQRTKIASGIMFRRSFILADEPLAGLDPFGRNLVLNLFKELKEEGSSILISSHILFEVEKFTNDLILIYNGQIVATGSTTAIRKHLTDFPYTFKIRSSNHAQLLKQLIDTPEEIIQSVEILPVSTDTVGFNKGREIFVTTAKPEAFQDYMMELAAITDSDLTVFEMKNIETEAQTEAIFQYLIK